jgi:polyphosphate kinase
LPIPNQIDRFVALPTEGERLRFLPLEELLILHVSALFPGYKLTGSCSFRVLRDSDLEVEEEAEDLVREFETALKRRRRGEVVRLQISTNAPKDLRAEITEKLVVTGDEVVEVSGMIGLTAVKELVLDKRTCCCTIPMKPLTW